MNLGLENSIGKEGVLADAFSAFVNAAGRLEETYATLRAEVSQLRQQLKDRDAQLATSLAENQRVRRTLHCIVEALPCGVVVLDEKQNVVLSNPEAHRLFAGVEELAEQHPAPALLQKHLGSAADDGDDEQELSVGAPEAKRWLAVRKRQLQLADHGVNTKARVVLIARDVTSHKEVEQQREQNRNLVALAEIATVLAHEIRNPLGSLELMAGLLAQAEGLGQDSQEWVSNIQAGIRSLSGTVNNILSFHSLGTPDLVPVALGDLLTSSISFVRPLAEQAGIELTLDVKAKNIRIAGDANSLRQVILNVACNAFKFTPAGGFLKVSVERVLRGAQRRVVVHFRDTGIGIAPENIEHIFEAGFSTGSHSPGLGLAICKRIIEQHGGEIRVRSQVGQGSTFSLELPAL